MPTVSTTVVADADVAPAAFSTDAALAAAASADVATDATTDAASTPVVADANVIATPVVANANAAASTDAAPAAASTGAASVVADAATDAVAAAASKLVLAAAAPTAAITATTASAAPSTASPIDENDDALSIMAQMQNFRARSATRRLDHTIKCTQRVISNAAIVQHTAEQEELEAATGTSGMGASWTYGRVYDAISELSSDSELELSFAMCLLHVLEGGPVAEAIAAQWVVECAHKYHVALVEDIAKADKVFARICQFTRAAKNAAHGAGLRREKLLMIAAELSK